MMQRTSKENYFLPFLLFVRIKIYKTHEGSCLYPQIALTTLLFEDSFLGYDFRYSLQQRDVYN